MAAPPPGADVRRPSLESDTVRGVAGRVGRLHPLDASRAERDDEDIILRLEHFTLMIHPQEAHAEEFADTRLGVGIHLQIQVDDVDAFYQHCIDEGALLSVSGEPADQNWGWREFALKDPDGYVWSIYQDKSGGQWT